MRCSSCEPLLDAYLETSLGRLRHAQIAEHLRACSRCAELLSELRVIDALLTTARSPGRVRSDFTATVVSAARTTRPHVHRRLPVWIPILAYLAIAWALAASIALVNGGALALLGGIVTSQERGLAALAAAARALAPATPLAAAAVTGILLLDLLLLCALFFGYRRFRPLLALYLSREPRP